MGKGIGRAMARPGRYLGEIVSWPSKARAALATPPCHAPSLRPLPPATRGHGLNGWDSAP